MGTIYIMYVAWGCSWIGASSWVTAEYPSREACYADLEKIENQWNDLLQDWD